MIPTGKERRADDILIGRERREDGHLEGVGCKGAGAETQLRESHARSTLCWSLDGKRRGRMMYRQMMYRQLGRDAEASANRVGPLR